MSHAVDQIALSDRIAAPARERRTIAELRLDAQAILKRNLRLVLTTALATLLFGLAFVILSPAKYKSSAQLLVDPRGLQILKNDITRAPENADGNLVDVENQRYILLSRSILGAVVDREKLADNPAFAGNGPGLMARILGRPQASPRTRAMQTLADMVEVVRGERAYVLDVVVTSKDPNVSANIANVIARIFLEAQIEARSDAAKKASEDLTKRAEDLRAEVQKAEKEVEKFRAEHGLVQTLTGRPLGEQQVTDLSAQLGLARGRIADAQARVEAVEKVRKSGQNIGALSEALNAPTIVSLRAQYAQAVQQAGSLATQLGPRHPALMQAQEQVRDVRRLIAAELDRIAEAAKVDLARARASEVSLLKQSGQVRDASDADNSALVQLRDLERAAEASRVVYQSFLGRAKELGESQGIDTANARVISPAVPALKPAGPPALLVLAGSLLFGLALGGGLAYVRERFDDSVRSRRELAAIIDLPVLAVLPVIQIARKKKADLVPDEAAFRRLLARVRPEPGHGDKTVAFIGADDDGVATQTIVALTEFARWDKLDVAIVCNRDSEKIVDAFETGERRVLGRGHVEVAGLSDLTSGARKTLRQFQHIVARADLVLVDAPSPLDNADAGFALDLADHIVLILRAPDIERARLQATFDALADYDDRIAGLVLVGDLPVA
ncbi:MAG: GumC family protein [Rhodoblastus sp.]